MIGNWKNIEWLPSHPMLEIEEDFSKILLDLLSILLAILIGKLIIISKVPVNLTFFLELVFLV
jgi:hypothetical protein